MNVSWVKYLPGFLGEKLKNRPLLQAMLGNSSWLLLDKLVRIGIGLVVGVWLARYLGPERFGQFNFAIAFVALFSPIAILGLDGIVVRELVRHPENRLEILGSAFALKMAGGLLAFALALTAILGVRPQDESSQWLVGVISAGMIFQAFDIADLWFQSKVQSKYSVLAKNGAFLVLTVAKVWLILSQAEVIAFAWVSTAELTLGAVGLIMAFRSRGNRWLELRPTWAAARRLMRESWPLFLSSLGAMLYMRVDQVMLAQMVGEREVGLYSAAVRLSELWYLVPPVIVSSVMPFLAEARTRSESVYYQRLQQLFTLLIRVSLLVAIPISLLATPLTSLIFGSAYEASGSILAVHIWSVVFVFMSAGTTPWIINEKLAKLALYQTSLGAVLNIGLNLYLIPRHGAIGAAIATICSQCVSIWLASYFLIDGRRLFWLQTNAMLLGIRGKSPHS